MSRKEIIKKLDDRHGNVYECEDGELVSLLMDDVWVEITSMSIRGVVYVDVNHKKTVITYKEFRDAFTELNV
jgi:hypothetical protein